LRIVQDQIAKVPDNSNFYVLLDQVELRNQDSAKAEQAFQKAVDLNQNNVNAFLLLSSVQITSGSVDQGIAGYRSALQSNPRDIRIYVA
jgi:cytochrome c-type biogenesis protein CcmH/NrfG